MENSTTPLSPSQHPSLTSRSKRSFKSEGQPAIVTGDIPAAMTFHSPPITSNGSTSSSASLYTPWASHPHSVPPIHPFQAMNSSFSTNDDGHGHFYPAGANPWGFQHGSPNTTAHGMPSSFSSSAELQSANLDFVPRHSAYNGLSIISSKPGRVGLTPSASPETMLPTPTSDKFWSYNRDCGDDSIERLSNRAGQSTSPILRSDGLRKKNAKFDIPEERSLENIDQLISESKCEDLVKELKTQKRLLKNREAALQSRQRKKLHTEQLEGEKKRLQNRISSLEEELAMYQADREGLRHSHDLLEQQRLQLEWQKAEGDKKFQQLRTENSQLKHQVRCLQQPAHSPPSSTILTPSPFDDFADNLGPMNFSQQELMTFMNNHPCSSMMTGSRDPSMAMNMIENFHPSDLLPGPGESKTVAVRFILVLIMASSSILASRSHEHGKTSFMTTVPENIRSLCGEIIDCVLERGSVAVLKTLSCADIKSVDLDQGITDMILNAQNYITPDVVHELKDLVDFTTSQIRSQSISGMERSPKVGMVGPSLKSRR